MDLRMEFEGDDVVIVECENAIGDVIIPRTIHSDDHENLNVGHEFTIRSIVKYAFSCCEGITSIHIPDTVTSIDGSAFSDCPDLESIVVDDDNPNYTSRDGVLFDKDVTFMIKFPEGKKGDYVIPKGVIALGEFAFSRGPGLTSVTFPDSITSLEDCTFAWCPNLISINVNAGNGCFSSKDGVLFDKNGTALIKYPEGKRGDYIVPEGVISIRSWAFSECPGLTSIIIPEGVTSIEDWSFNECTGLSSISIPEGVRSIGNFAFSTCVNLNSVKIPANVRSIGNNAFDECHNLTSMTIPEGVTSVREYTFSGCCNLESVTLPESITSIKDNAFAGCCALTSIDIPKNVTSIGRYAFKGCSKLTSIVIPEGVTSIDDWAFSECTGLESIHIPRSVESMGLWVFNECTGLKRVYLDSDIDYDFGKGVEIVRSKS